AAWREDRRRRTVLRDQRRNAPKRRLLVNQSAHSIACLGVCDRGGHQLGELLEPVFHVGRQTVLRREDGYRTPEAVTDEDRAADSRHDAESSSSLGSDPPC